MPLKWFKCRDGKQIEASQCLKKCRIADKLPGGRCLTVRTLRFIADERVWNGTPSTTQLIKGTREAFLEITENYALDPQSAIFRIIGSRGHAVLDKYVGDNELGEERIKDEISSGQFDFYENGQLSDTKTSGSYKVMRAKGIYQVEVPTGEIYKSGAKKGQPKTRKEFREGGRKDRLDWAIQLNDYRMKLESLGFPVTSMVIEVLCRDGGTYIAESRGIFTNGELIQINRISDQWVRRYMNKKYQRLMTALETGKLPPRCSYRETWNRKKCEKYCTVSDKCYEIENLLERGA